MSQQEKLEEEGEVPFSEHIKQRMISTNTKCCSSDSLGESEEVSPSVLYCAVALGFDFVTLSVLLSADHCDQRGSEAAFPSGESWGCSSLGLGFVWYLCLNVFVQESTFLHTLWLLHLASVAEC